MQVFTHHIYEYKKGVRDLFLHTMPVESCHSCISWLEKSGIDYWVQKVNDRKVNVYFGKKTCVAIVRGFGNKPLNEFSDEEDFMLGIMLGYSKDQQYDRYQYRKTAAIGAA